VISLLNFVSSLTLPLDIHAEVMPVFEKACAFSNRLSVATEPYLSIPRGIINKLELSSRRQELSEKRRKLNAERDKEATSNPPANSSRQSARIPLLSAAKRAAEEIALQKAERDWRHENCSAASSCVLHSIEDALRFVYLFI
jgi:hypothetical protein